MQSCWCWGKGAGDYGPSDFGSSQPEVGKGQFMPTKLLLAPPLPDFQTFLQALKCINLGIRFLDGPSFFFLSSCSSYARKTFEFSSFDIMVQTCKPNVKSVHINLRHQLFDQSYMKNIQK